MDSSLEICSVNSYKSKGDLIYMVTQYFRSFEQIVSTYKKNSTHHHKTYQTESLSSLLVYHINTRLLREVISGQYDQQRLNAINQLAKWGRNRTEIRILTHISEHEPNLELRAAAVNAIDKIRLRLG